MTESNCFSPFLVKAIEHIAERQNRWENVVIVLPSKRARVFFMQHLQKKLSSVQLAPTLWSIEGFIAELANGQSAPLLRQLRIFYTAYRAFIPAEAREEFSSFLQWAPRLLKDLNDIDAYGLEEKEVLEYLASYYALESMGETTMKQGFTSVFWQHLPAIFQQFKSSLSQSGWATMGMLYREALAVLTLYFEQTEKHHYFIGFNALNASEEILFQEFLVAQKGEVLWDIDHHFYDDTTQAVGRFIRQYQNNWNFYRQSPYRFAQQEYLTPKNIHIYGVTGEYAQAQQLRKILDREQLDYSQTAVVLGDENLLLPVLSALPENVEQFNVTLGYAIKGLPVTRFFMQYLRLHATAHEQKFSLTTAVEVMAFEPFRNYLIKERGAHVTAQWKDLSARLGGELSVDDWEAMMPAHWSMVQVNSEEEGTANFLTHLCEVHQAILPFLSSALTQSAAHAFGQLLFQAQQLVDESDFHISLSAVMVVLEESLHQQGIDFKGDPIHGLQIMGMLETRVLDFENLIITSVNEGILPMGKNDQSFFPFALKKKFGLPTFLDNDAIYAYHFFRLIQRAKNVHLIYNNSTEGLGGGEKSRFIHYFNLLGQKEHQVIAHPCEEVISSSQRSKPSIEKTPQMMDQLKKIAEKGFSPTSLSAYLTDPMVFYDRYLLGVQPIEEQNKVMSNLRRGELVHDTLEQLYKPYLNSVMSVKFFDQMLSELPKIMAQCYAKHYPVITKSKGENALIYAAYQRAIEQYLTHERSNVSSGDELIVRALEKPFSCAMENAPFPMNFRGKIDRIDEYNGQLRLIDYKTGNVETSHLQWSSPDLLRGDYKRQPMFQLLLYAWALQRMNEVSLSLQAGVVSLKAPHKGLLVLRQKSPVDPDCKSLVDGHFIREFEEFLSGLVDEIFAEQNPFVSLKEG